MFKKLISNPKMGFTLIEITIVVGIIVVLTSIAVVAGSSAKSLARDNQRKTDIRLLQVKLEAYREMNGRYPTSLNSGNDSLVSGPTNLGSGIISATVLPKDPSTKADYNYFPLNFDSGVSACGLSYYLYATLEKNNSDHVDRTISPMKDLAPCPSGSLPTISNFIYDVTSPK